MRPLKPVITRDEILRVHYGWRHAPAPRWGRDPEEFDPAAIGLAKYNAAQTAVSRALNRLVARGLLGGPSRRCLTRQGHAEATKTKGLSVEFGNNCSQTQPLSGKELEDLAARAAWERSLSEREDLARQRRIAEALAIQERTNLWQRDYARRRRAAPPGPAADHGDPS